MSSQRKNNPDQPALRRGESATSSKQMKLFNGEHSRVIEERFFVIGERIPTIARRRGLKPAQVEHAVRCIADARLERAMRSYVGGPKRGWEPAA
jgi:hypothetical protein